MITNMRTTEIRYNFGLKQRKNPQTPGDLALAKLPLEDSKVKSLKKEREKEMKCQCLYIHRDREYNSPLRNLCIGADKMTGWQALLKHKPKICV